MHLFYCDETNLDPAKSVFFVYGGVVIPPSTAAQLSSAIDEERKRLRIPANYQLKFNPGPDGLSHTEFSSLKQYVLEKASEANCIMLVSIILHDIAKSPDEARQYEINRNLYHFNCVMNRLDSYGLVLIDRFTDTQIDSQLRERFSIGVIGLPYSERYRLEKILGFHYSCIGQSNFASVVDIAIGSFRFAVNAFSLKQADRIVSARKILQILRPLFLHEDDGRVSDISLHFSPDVVRWHAYRKKYESMKSFFQDCGINPTQEILKERRF